jgi:hypothetical protein
MSDQPGNNKGHRGYKKRQQVTIRPTKWRGTLTKRTTKQLVIPMAEKVNDGGLYFRIQIPQHACLSHWVTSLF